MAVTISDPNDWQDHIALLESGFQKFKHQTIVQENEVLGTAEIAGGEYDGVELIAKEEFAFPMSEDEKAEIILPSPGFVYAPVAQCQDAGYAQVYVDNQWVGKIPLIYGRTVEQEVQPKPKILERLLGGKRHDRTHSEDSF